MTLMLLEYSLIFLGLAALAFSLVGYYRRTGQPVTPKRLLNHELILDAREFLFNRIGLYLLAMGVIIRYVSYL